MRISDWSSDVCSSDLKEGSCGADKAKEGSCGADKAKEGKCGVAAMDSDKDGKVSRAEFDAAHADKAGMFDEIDTDKDGFMDADEAKAHDEGRCGSDKKADGAEYAEKTGMDGKGGEGRCGGM